MSVRCNLMGLRGPTRVLVIVGPSFSGTRHRHKQSGLLLREKGQVPKTQVRVTHRLARVVALQWFVGAVLIESTKTCIIIIYYYSEVGTGAAMQGSIFCPLSCYWPQV